MEGQRPWEKGQMRPRAWFPGENGKRDDREGKLFFGFW